MANVLKFEKKVAVISLLCEGSSIRAVERITGVNQNTIMSLGRRVGEACAKIMDEKMRNLPCQQIEVDEVWGYIGAKQKNPCRMGPLSFEARLDALAKVKDIQARAEVDLINAEEEARILELIALKTWPDGWDGSEPLASLPFDDVNRDGSVQPIMRALMR